MDGSLIDSDANGLTLEAELRPGERALPGTRAWFVLYLVWMTGLALAAVGLLGRTEAGEPWARWGWTLALMGFYLSLCNSFLPLPTAWVVLLAAAPGDGLLNPALRVIGVALLGTLATIVANLNEYHLLSYLLHFGLGRRMRRTKLFGWAVRWFDRAPFQVLVLIAFVPLPIDAVRWLAILRGYPRGRFALAYLVGRAPRYLLFAGCSVLMELSGRQIALIQIVLLAAAVGARLVPPVIRGARRRLTAADQ